MLTASERVRYQSYQLTMFWRSSSAAHLATATPQSVRLCPAGRSTVPEPGGLLMVTTVRVVDWEQSPFLH
ncbi:hypothetical protein D3C87_2176400 [compost metagenome]